MINAKSVMRIAKAVDKITGKIMMTIIIMTMKIKRDDIHWDFFVQVMRSQILN